MLVPMVENLKCRAGVWIISPRLGEVEPGLGLCLGLRTACDNISSIGSIRLYFALFIKWLV